MKNIFAILAIALFASCQGGTAKKTQAKIDSAIVSNASTPENAVACYQYIKNRDTATLTVKTAGNQVSGSLGYNLYEKDKNSGTFSGLVKGDTLIADYTFHSEGKISVREIALLKQGDKLIEGFGDVEEIKGNVKFKDITKLKFDNSIVFSKINCK
ncbi:hypothetical protein OC25_14755 [Pedobacter kyungheensis]|uniref:Lipoprotein n=1 Tax=Pedobacter kyungheensis TaxID=1069985 RepID=A0A0C1FJ65_9SPHI|nr:hypothetical protein [Pedobacter kyungheensis]KIA92962.1 hypothetical protein OC25_14755 [Pedobacter kyungheensis]